MVSMRGYLSQFCLGYVVVSVFAQCWPGPDLDGSVQVYSVQLYRAQYRVVCSTQHCSHSRLGREAVRDCPAEAVYKAASLRLSANSEPSVSTKIAAVRRDSGTGRET